MFDKYLTALNRLFCSGIATEHSYRPAFQECLKTLLRDVQVTNEPKRQKCGAPDYILTSHNIDIGYIEAKDIGVDLNAVENDEQLTRYRKSLDNLILTDYVDFRFFLNGQKVEQVHIAVPMKSGLAPIPENFVRLQSLLLDFAAFEGQPIKSAKKLAEMMAHKAALMRDVFFKALKDESESETTLLEQFDAFKAVLVHDMDEAQFADVYAQTIAYGLFTARLHDLTPKNFSRGEALTLIPKSNPFLQKLFQYVAGGDLDARVIWIVDALCEVFRYADLIAILKDFGTATGKNDPILHFYETFLAKYDPKLRKSRAIFYTPEPVVRYIVRAIDDVLKSHFDVKDGIANTGKVKIKVDGHASGETTSVEQEVHKIQLLDVATGTGTFLAEVVKQIYTRFAEQKGMWSDYVDRHLIPRIHGFELLMAPYTMCHMKLDLLLQQTEYKPTGKGKRLNVYLTNSLEEHHKNSNLPFANWLSREANEASRIKREIPIMVALGNPPYKGISSNMNSWIAKTKIKDYKYVNGVHFNERKHWLNDDYVQFIRLGEYYVEKNGEGILAYITNHSYLDNPTFRGMRWHLMNTFDDIYILDLHGNAKKKESAPNGSPDKNVFDIQQGVAIIVAIKQQQKDKERSLAKLYHADLWGPRETKYNALDTKNLLSMDYKMLDVREPFYFFVPQSYNANAEYQLGFALDEMFPANVTGIVTMGDAFIIDKDKNTLRRRLHSFIEEDIHESQLKADYDLGKNYAHWIIKNKRKINIDDSKFTEIAYRPFDQRWTYYDNKLIWRRRDKIMCHFLKGDNLGLIGMRHYSYRVPDYCYSFVSRNLIDNRTFISNKGICIYYPLWIHEDVLFGAGKKCPNLDTKIYKGIQKIIPDVQPQSLFDYIYAVLHSRSYRKRYAEFLKSDFPRIPYPKDKKTFHALAAEGEKLRALHLMESPLLNHFVTTYPVSGNHEIVEPRWEAAKGNPALGCAWINQTQHFYNVPLVAWEFYIGGYQPAQKWLKDRKGHRLTSDDLIHWQRIIVALTETNRVMNDIDKLIP